MFYSNVGKDLKGFPIFVTFRQERVKKIRSITYGTNMKGLQYPFQMCTAHITTRYPKARRSVIKHVYPFQSTHGKFIKQQLIVQFYRTKLARVKLPSGCFTASHWNRLCR